MTCRFLAHRVAHRGMVHPLCVLEVTDGIRVRLTPCSGECAATRFVDGTLAVLDADCAAWHSDGRPLRIMVIPPPYPPAGPSVAGPQAILSMTNYSLPLQSE